MKNTITVLLATTIAVGTYLVISDEELQKDMYKMMKKCHRKYKKNMKNMNLPYFK